MPDTYLTFVGTTDPATSATLIGRALSLDFTERESLFLGGEYFRAKPSWGEVIVQHNDDQGEPAEPSHPDAPTVVSISTDVTETPRIVAALSKSGFTQI